MKLKNILFLILSLFWYSEGFCMLSYIVGASEELKNIAKVVSPEAEDLNSALQKVIGDSADTLQQKAHGITKNAILGVVDGLRDATKAPAGASIAECVVKGVNDTLGTTGNNLGQAAGGLLNHMADTAVNHLGSPVGTPLAKALENLQTKAVTSTTNNLMQLKEASVATTKEILYNISKKALIAGIGISSLALGYYLLKKYTYRGSLNATNLSKSNLIAESSGYSSTIMGIPYFRKGQAPLGELIMAPGIKLKAKKIIEEFHTSVENRHKNSNKVTFKSLLVHGVSGTGKALFVKHLMNSASIDHLIINSSSFINYKDGTESWAVAALFGLLKDPKKPIVLVIEEADILLNRPAYKNKLLDLLKWVKINKNQFKLVLCVEDKKLLDKEVLALIDEDLGFTLPGVKEREIFLKQGLVKGLAIQKQRGIEHIKENILKHINIAQIAREAEGFSFTRLQLLLDQFKSEIFEATTHVTKDQVNTLVQNQLADYRALVFK